MFWRIFAQTIWQKEVSMEKELDLLIATEMSGDGDSVAEVHGRRGNRNQERLPQSCRCGGSDRRGTAGILYSGFRSRSA